MIWYTNWTAQYLRYIILKLFNLLKSIYEIEVKSYLINSKYDYVLYCHSLHKIDAKI